MGLAIADLDEAAATPPRLCLCGCEQPVEARSGPGRPSVYASTECRRRIEYRARKELRPGKPVSPRDSRQAIGVRIADPVKLARGWFLWRYPEHYPPAGDGRNPAGFRTILEDYPDRVHPFQGFSVRMVLSSDVEITELAMWIKGLPRYQQQDFACRAIEARTGQHMMAESPDRRVSHGDGLDYRPDPVTLGQLRAFYRPGECLEAGCHGEPHGNGLCRHHYDERRNPTLAR